jgi:hypothetical protein
LLMLGVTHQRIVRKIAELLKLDARECALFETGSVHPDSWANFPHHKNKRNETVQNVLSSRKLFLENDDECYFKLGVALHYVQDRWTLRPRLADAHTKWEVKIESEKIVDDNTLEDVIRNKLILPSKVVTSYLSFLSITQNGVDGITEGANTFTHYYLKMFNGVCRRVIIFAMIDHPSDWSHPILDLNFAYRISYELSRSILSPISNDNSNDQWNDKEWLKKTVDILPKVTFEKMYGF